MQRVIRRGAAGAVLTTAAWLASPAPLLAQEALGIADLAPRRAFLVASVPSGARTMQALEQSRLGALWREPQVQDFLDAGLEDASQSFADWLDSTGLERDELQPPTGPAGLALFFDENPETGQPEIQMLLTADYGETSEQMMEVITKVAENLVREEEATWEEVAPHNGIDIFRIEPVEAEEDPVDEEMEEFEWEEESPPFDQPLFIARVGPMLLASTHLDTLHLSIDRVDDGVRVDAIAQEPAWTGALAQHPEQMDAYLVLLPRPVAQPITEMLASDFGEAMGLDEVVTLLDAAGLRNVGALSMALRVGGTPGAVMESTLGVLVPEKKGLVALFEGLDASFSPPAFVGDDVASYLGFRFRFEGLFDAIRQIVAALPDDQREFAEAALPQAEQTVGPLLKVAGPEVHIVTSYSRPLGADSQQMVVAIRHRDELTVSQLLTGFAPMLGIESRDFEGNLVYDFPDDSGAMGVGFDHIFIGVPPASVETAMRAAARADLPKLAASGDYRAAAAGLSAQALGHQYQDFSRELEWIYWTIQNADKIALAETEALLQQWEEFGGMDDEFREQMLEEARNAKPAWADKLPPLDLVLRYVGDSVGEIRSTPDGFRGRAIWLEPR